MKQFEKELIVTDDKDKQNLIQTQGNAKEKVVDKSKINTRMLMLKKGQKNVRDISVGALAI